MHDRCNFTEQIITNRVSVDSARICLCPVLNEGRDPSVWLTKQRIKSALGQEFTRSWNMPYARPKAIEDQ